MIGILNPPRPIRTLGDLPRPVRMNASVGGALTYIVRRITVRRMIAPATIPTIVNVPIV